MAIEVELPDGRVVEFPDGTDNATMERALAQFAQPQSDFSQVSGSADTVPAQEPRGALASIGREAGLGARSVLQGIGSTIGIVTDPLAGMVDRNLAAMHDRQPKTLSGLIAGEQPAPRLGTSREGFSALADLLRLPTPETGSERVGGQITEALSGGGGVMALGRQLATRGGGMVSRGIGEALSTAPRSQLAGLVGGSGAAGVTREQGGGMGAQTIAGLLGGLSPAVAATTGAASLRALLRGGEAGRQTMERNIQDFASVGAQPSVGQATGNRRTQGLESLLAGGPTSGGRMADFAERQAQDIGRGLQRRADDFMPNASSERAGRAVERGVDSFVEDVKAARGALYAEADRHIPPGTVIPLANTTSALSSLTRVPASAPGTGAALVNQEIRSLAERVTADLARSKGRSTFSGAGVQLEPGLDFEAVRAIRTRIGEELSDFSLVADRPTAQYKRLYAALSRDLEEAARQQGPQAEQAFRRANSYTRASADRLEQVQRVVDKNGGPEKVYNAVMAGTQDGGTTLRAVMQSLPKDGQRAVTAAVIKRMGLATPGNQNAAGDVFSAQTFLTKWGNVSPEARRALFDRHGPQFSADMDKIARVAANIRDGAKVYANPAGTANRAAAIGYYGSLAGTAAAAPFTGGAPLALLVGGGLSANAAARVMTNPKVVSWLARTTEMPAGALPQQLVILQGIAEDDPAAAELLGALQQAEQPNR